MNEKSSMSTVPQIKGYYETYWKKGKDTFSGDQQGYAKNFRRWMAAQLEIGRAHV